MSPPCDTAPRGSWSFVGTNLSLVFFLLIFVVDLKVLLLSMKGSAAAALPCFVQSDYALVGRQCCIEASRLLFLIVRRCNNETRNER
jgi:hypothetical protein